MISNFELAIKHLNKAQKLIKILNTNNEIADIALELEVIEFYIQNEIINLQQKENIK
jgi:hypothetical protein